MRKTAICSVLFIVAVVLALAGPGAASAQGDGTISTTVIDAGVFVTVKETAQGDVLSLYRVSGDRIILVDAVINSGQQSSMRVNLSKRYLHHLDLENK